MASRRSVQWVAWRATTFQASNRLHRVIAASRLARTSLAQSTGQCSARSKVMVVADRPTNTPHPASGISACTRWLKRPQSHLPSTRVASANISATPLPSTRPVVRIQPTTMAPSSQVKTSFCCGQLVSNHHGAWVPKGHMMSRSISQVAMSCLMAMNQGLAVQWKAPMAIPSRPYSTSALSQRLLWVLPNCTTSTVGGRKLRVMASRWPLQRPHMWQSEAPFMLRRGTSGAQLMGMILCCGWQEARQASSLTLQCSGASLASNPKTPLTGHRYLHHTRLSRPYRQPTTMAPRVEPPSTSSTALGYWQTLTICPQTVVRAKATKGQPPQRIHFGMARPRPCLLANSVSAPSGQSTPHHTRPMSTMLTSTKGHQMPQKANWAITVRLDQRWAVSSGRGRNTGTRIRMAQTATTIHCRPRMNAPLRRIHSPVRESRFGDCVQVFMQESDGFLPLGCGLGFPIEGRAYHDPIERIDDHRQQRRTGAVAGQGRDQAAQRGGVIQQCRGIPEGCGQGHGPVGRGQRIRTLQQHIEELFDARHQQACGQQQQDHFGDLEETTPREDPAAQLQQVEGQEGQAETDRAGQYQGRRAGVLLPQADPVQEHRRLAALAGDGQHHQHEHTPPVATVVAGLHGAFHVLLEGAAMLAHPEHHLHDQHGGDQDDGNLEPGLGVAREQFRESQQRRAQGCGQYHAGHHAPPQVGDAAPRAGIAVLQPGIENTDHQKRLDALAPDDEHDLTHEAILPCQNPDFPPPTWRRSRLAAC
eukprot:TRINITY_DN2278_c0_g4_i1.p1 TRINITY_DN2278_c0_g4~~TRINITY_DN2278_c0_g4_i1.p1  ORF type:complete len:759 (-),score=204.48 TRINITY_DN2278_c0_g4_i1:1653-3929(-)